MLFICFLLFDFIQIDIKDNFEKCNEETSSEYDCQAILDILISFYGCGLFIVMWLLLLFAARYYEIAIRKKRGIKNMNDYPEFLMVS